MEIIQRKGYRVYFNDEAAENGLCFMRIFPEKGWKLDLPMLDAEGVISCEASKIDITPGYIDELKRLIKIKEENNG